MSSTLLDVPNLSHFHIRWLPSFRLDRQRFESLESAERQALEKVLAGATFIIVPATEACRVCSTSVSVAPTQKAKAVHAWGFGALASWLGH
jgi:hypothetical protein